MIKLAVFLGNTGKDYEFTRHNAGFLALSALFPSLSFSVKFHSGCAKKDGVAILKPLTLMNLSGTAVSEAKTFFKLKSEEIMVVHDDIELPLGEVRYSLSGPLRGHNGLRSIKERIGSDSFYRLRIGIGRPPHGDVAHYVLARFTEGELSTLNALFSRLAKEDIFALNDGFSLKI